MMADKPDALARPKRFYRTVAVAAADGAFRVELDGRTPRTPGGARLAAPTRALAELVAEEWAAQGEFIDAQAMAATRLANTAIDRVSQTRAQTAEVVARYAGSDLLCYRAEHPRALVEEEAARWDPMLDWAAEALGVRLHPAAGVVHRAQDPQALAQVGALALALDDFGLAGLAHGAGLLGSAVLALALLGGVIGGDEAFALSHLDETFQARLWGEDAEAAVRAQGLRAEAMVMERWFRALG